MEIKGLEKKNQKPLLLCMQAPKWARSKGRDASHLVT